jgi:hypothetical protein
MQNRLSARRPVLFKEKNWQFAHLINFNLLPLTSKKAAFLMRMKGRGA